MKLLVISHKETWYDSSSPSCFSTIGGFPFQMKAISESFDETIIIIPIRETPLPSGARHLSGHNLHIIPLSEPKGVDLERKLHMLVWFPRHLPLIWREVRLADAVHAPVGGDIGTIGILVALVQRKPLFVRHCGTWGMPISQIDRLLQRFLERIAGGRNVIMATGGADFPPSRKNSHIQWIFSTSLTTQEITSLELAQPWQKGWPLKLVTVGRLSAVKNIASIINALPRIREIYPDVSLDVVGDGESLEDLIRLAERLGLADRVVFHGSVSHADVMRILSNSHLFVFPTLREGFPKALLEAMACGLLAVATNTSVIPYLLQDCGYILNDTSPDEVAKGVLALLNNHHKLVEMSCLARKKALSYTLESWRDTISERLQTAWGPLKEPIQEKNR